MNFLQIWVESKLQNITPRYQRRSFSREGRKNKFQTIISSEEGWAHCWINQNAKLSLACLDAGKSLNYQLNPINKCVYLFCLEGSLSIDGVVIKRRDGVGLWHTASFDINAEQACEFIVIEVPVNYYVTEFAKSCVKKLRHK